MESPVGATAPRYLEQFSYYIISPSDIDSIAGARALTALTATNKGMKTKDLTVTAVGEHQVPNTRGTSELEQGKLVSIPPSERAINCAARINAVKHWRIKEQVNKNKSNDLNTNSFLQLLDSLISSKTTALGEALPGIAGQTVSGIFEQRFRLHYENTAFRANASLNITTMSTYFGNAMSALSRAAGNPAIAFQEIRRFTSHIISLIESAIKGRCAKHRLRLVARIHCQRCMIPGTIEDYKYYGDNLNASQYPESKYLDADVNKRSLLVTPPRSENIKHYQLES